jgi:Xaa-Pro aminopeptidase
MFKDVIEKIQNSVEASGLEAILVFDADNARYLSGANLPFLKSYPDRPMAILWPRNESPVCICPVEWESSFLAMSWIDKTQAYVESPKEPSIIASAVADLLKSRGVTKGKIGVDHEGISVDLHESLVKALSNLEVIPCDILMRDLRLVKTPGELAHLEDVAYRADHALFGTIHHVLVTSTRSEMSLSEEIRVHAMERDLDVIGHNSVGPSASGEHTKKFWPLAPKFGMGFSKHLKPGEYVRVAVKTSLDGYWSDASRIMTMGEPTQEQSDAYASLRALNEAAIERIKPGTESRDIYAAVHEKAKELPAELVPGLGIGHGVGVSPLEPPLLNTSDATVLREGMVLVVGPMIYGPKGEILVSKDTVIVTKEGCRRVSTYMDWREPYVANWTL